MGLRHLRIVLTVAEAGSISRAAATLRIAQSGLTAQLRRIEGSSAGRSSAAARRRRADRAGVHVLGRARSCSTGSAIC
ncbi:LysR family transcriptional regulator [Streptomyces sp. M19]